MKKTFFVALFSVALFSLGCAEAPAPAPTPLEPTCVEAGKCVAGNPTIKCCDAGFTVQRDEASCAAAPSGAVGGNTHSCQATPLTPLEPTCVEAGKCVAAVPFIKCCTEGHTAKTDTENCPVAEGVLGGMPWSCQA